MKRESASLPGTTGWFAVSLGELTEITRGQESSGSRVPGYSDISYLYSLTRARSEGSHVGRTFNFGVVQMPREAWLDLLEERAAGTAS